MTGTFIDQSDVDESHGCSFLLNQIQVQWSDDWPGSYWKMTGQVVPVGERTTYQPGAAGVVGRPLRSYHAVAGKGRVGRVPTGQG